MEHLQMQTIKTKRLINIEFKLPFIITIKNIINNSL